MNKSKKKDYPKPNVTADIIITREDNKLLLIKRLRNPFKDFWALPGGFIEVGFETIEECAVREAHEETNLAIKLAELVGIWSEPQRDPRGHTITCVFKTRSISIAESQYAKPKDDASDILWINPYDPEFEKLNLAFDHLEIIKSVFK